LQKDFFKRSALPSASIAATDELIKRADCASFVAKSAGRNHYKPAPAPQVALAGGEAADENADVVAGTD
jgi:hypothetical protein